MTSHHPAGLRHAARRRLHRIRRWADTTPSGEIIATLAVLYVTGVVVLGVVLYLVR